MKKISLLFIFLLLCLPSIFAQNTSDLKKEIETLKQQIERLKEKVDFCNLYEKSSEIDTRTFNSNFDLKVLSCIGNTTEQTVVLEILIEHKLPNQKLDLWTYSKKPMAYDEIGNGYEYKEARFPQSRSGMGTLTFPVLTNVPVKGQIVFRNILSQTDKLRMITGGFDFQNSDGGGNKGEGQFEIRNVSIEWK